MLIREQFSLPDSAKVNDIIAKGLYCPNRNFS